MTSLDYLTSLQNDRTTLVNNLTTKGISGLTGNETFTELAPKVLDIPSGGSTIQGTTINSVIQSGSITKGEFVGKGSFEKTDRLSSTTNYKLGSNATISNFANVYDNNDDNYATILSSSSSTQIYINCKSRSDLNIPNNANLKSISVSFKISYSNIYSANKLVYYHKFMLGSVGNNNYTIENKNYDTGYTFPMIETYNYDSQFINPNENTSDFGIRPSVPVGVSIYLYYVTFNIIYEHEGQIKTLTTGGDIVGVANENGNQGDTIEVIVPNIE